MAVRTKNLAFDTKTPAPAGPSVGAGYAKGLVDVAVAKGANRKELVARAQIAEHDLEDIDARIPLARYVALIEIAAALTGEPALALQYGEAVRMQDISIVGLICEACETTGEVGVQLNRYSRLVFDHIGGADIIRLSLDAEGLWIEGTGAAFDSYPLLVETEFARLVWNTRKMFTGNAQFERAPFPLALQFRHADPGYGAEYDRVFGAPVTFGAKWNAMRIDESFLTLRLPPTNRYVFGVLSERATALLKQLQSATTVRGRLEAVLMPTLHTGDVGMDVIAGKLALSRQTLARKLKAERTTFEQVLDELRHTVALHYLRGKKVSVNETAYLVGFSDPTTFSRAFKRWTGASPRTMRASETK